MENYAKRSSVVIESNGVTQSCGNTTFSIFHFPFFISFPLSISTFNFAWEIVHGLSQLLFFISLTIGLFIGILYLWQDRRLKLKLSRGTWKLPPLERLAKINRASLFWSLFALIPGIVSGIVLLNVRQTQATLLDYIINPTILGTSIIFLWILWTIIRSSILGAFSEAKAIARRTIFLFLLLILTLIAAFYSPVGHLRESMGIAPNEPVQTTSEVQK